MNWIFIPGPGPGRLWYANILSLMAFAMLLNSGRLCAQEIVVNEYYNPNTQNDEWTELVVVKDDLDLRGWYIGDNNAATSSWQPKIRFLPSNPFWNHLRAGTIIVLDHAAGTDDANCNDDAKYDYDKSDGFIRICVRNPDYFEGGSTSTLFLADGGDFVQLVNPSGKMIHGIGHDPGPGGSVLGSPCFSTSLKWTDINSANPDTPPCANGPYTFWKVGMSSPTSLKMIAPDLPAFSSGLLESAANAIIDTSDTAFEGIGNGQGNNPWLTGLRVPAFEAQTICAVKLPTGTISLTWNNMADPVPSDQTCGYMVVRSTTGDFGVPSQGKEYAVGSSYGTGNQTVTVAALLDNTGAATTTYTETGAGNFFYRIFPYRYKNTPVFEHPTRGRTYNTEQYVKVGAGEAPAVLVSNDTLCGPGTATLILQPFAQPGPGATLWYDAAVGGNLLLSNKDTLRVLVSQTTSFWLEFPQFSQCNAGRTEVKAVVKPIDCAYSSPDSVCEGVPALLTGKKQEGVSYRWEILSAPASVFTGSVLADTLKIQTMATAKKEWVVFSLQCQSGSNCLSTPVRDSVFTIPFECSLFSEPEIPVSGKPVLVSVRSEQSPWQVSAWNLRSSGELLEKSSFSLRFLPSSGSPDLEAEILRLNNRGEPLCRALRYLNPGLPNLLLGSGLNENRKLDFGSRKMTYLKVYNRWGQLLAEYGDNYGNSWPEEEPLPGIYFYEAGSRTGIPLKGWVEVRP